MFKKLGFIIIWLLFLILIKVPTLITGWVMVPILWFYRHTPYPELPWWSRLWSNLEDWEGQRPAKGKGLKVNVSSLPWWWAEQEGTGFWSFYNYHAFRNGADGLRSFNALNLNAKQDEVKFETNYYLREYSASNVRAAGLKSAKYWAWQGWKAGFDYTKILDDTHYRTFKIGWRVEPSDSVEPRREGALGSTLGFATTFGSERDG